MSGSTEHDPIQLAAAIMRDGGVVAYPTEYCFGLGCDPRNQAAVMRLLAIKHRQPEQGVILIAANTQQVECYADLDALISKQQILDSWPGPNTWLLPARSSVPNWVKGRHTSIAMRIPGHDLSLKLCQEFGFPIVSTSANRHGSPALLSADAVLHELGAELDYIIDAPVGGATAASTIRDAISGQILR
ncbi:L-threonylcarbamoyladenylate synthase [Arenicella xantha]|uniref:Threonylcarbamoyl-AMP synthase n=1 Tax=Arenicella xantha TaxID=644221 RepID=A0A395JGI7_9GAMM|nr:L-threonylcarbamoyladenylate synthase [Arenicella xantha]RBP48902.1 L-threonylcarbamoyladenylate synthase [Arenicella xantha]